MSDFELPVFKAHPHAIGKLMSRPTGLITDKQKAELARLDGKEKDDTITEKQRLTLADLREKAKNQPKLSQTAITFLNHWYIEQRFGRKREFTNKWTEKGLAVEDEAIELYSRVSGRDFIKKNETEFENEYICGTPDVVCDIIVDVKSSWDLFTFPMFLDECENTDYEWQLQGYMDLREKDGAELAYCLIDTPMELILKELNRIKWNSVNLPTTAEGETELEEEVTLNMTFSDLPEELRVKRFYIERDQDAIDRIHEKVRHCREYLEQIHNNLEMISELSPEK